MAAMGDFFGMGGYGAFVWPAYVLAFVVLVALLVVRFGRLKRREAELTRLEGRREEAPRAAAPAERRRNAGERA